MKAAAIQTSAQRIVLGVFMLLVSAAFAADHGVRYSSGAENSPWGVASGDEWSGEYPRFNVPLRQIGVTWLRYFPGWDSIQEAPGKWGWIESDPLVVNCRRNSIQLSGVLRHLAKFASADEGTKSFPVNDIEHWRNYVTGLVFRYKDEVGTWEVWNDFNGDPAIGERPEQYAELLAEAYKAAKGVDQKLKVGLNCTGLDLQFIDAVLRHGGAGKFDFVAVSPFMHIESLLSDANEPGFLSMASDLRTLLRRHGHDDKTELWISSIGYPAPDKPDKQADELQAEALLKAYILSLAQGFKRVFWHEAIGPGSRGAGVDYGLIRQDWITRPSFKALASMISLLGKDPIYLGWLSFPGDGCGFVFHGHTSKVLVAWGRDSASPASVRFSALARVVAHDGRESELPQGENLVLGRMPVFIIGIPGEMEAEARGNSSSPFPWEIDFARSREVSCRLGAGNLELGIEQIKIQTSRMISDNKLSWRQTCPEDPPEGNRMYFKVNPEFAESSPKMRIAILAMSPSEEQGSISLHYESLTGYRDAPEKFVIPSDGQWHSFSWLLEDAGFVAGWGWSIRLESGQSTPVNIKEVRIKKTK
ncbi:MAG: hypothetical protein JW808_09000 [Victivallales bacterium]|nr:hypothetical protein [Victivallales bacterium]